MDTVNRSVAIVVPREPYLEWTRQDDATGIAENVFEAMHEDPHAFLLPEYMDDKEKEAMLEHFSPAIFESMLDGWLRDRGCWPKNRDYEMFKKWFEVRICSVVEDLFLSQPLQHED